MFSISDVMVDKEEVSLTFQLPVTLDDEASRCLSEADIGKSLADILPETEQIYVSDNTDSVPETHILKIIQKSAKSPCGAMGFSAVNAAKASISYIDYPPAEGIFTGILCRLAAAKATLSTTLN